ncbi:bile acid:sodium symporter family protein [Lipingzhangella sp. LS1_29]|uniref:Bile acid:sodium symporter family protein n=1 Tax=Lipingzhangella rawalii TaxID=2055835 RepID=A0ABU2HB00_9ACTN|nr:bile acid:sodium symporter family protein [Lipingzhangella rawalii]MDS1272504.1 bile acid:sodium symporter family protein [Lipingzhangella rawalii]
MDSTLATVTLPAALAVVMLGLGLDLRPADFTRLVHHPRAAVLCMGFQLVLMPLACFGLVHLFGLPPALAVGMMLLAASPGGTTSGLYTHLFHGNVALSITLTAVNSVIAVVTMPLVVNLSLVYFAGDDGTLGLQFDKVVQVFAIVLVPVAVGMVIRHLRPRYATRMDLPVRIASVLVLAGVIAVALIAERENLPGYITAVGAVVLTFNVLNLAVGYVVPRVSGVRRTDAITCSFEIGLHNSTLAMAIALSPALLDSTEMAVPAAVYGVVMFGTATAAGFLMRGGRGAGETPMERDTPQEQRRTPS